MRLDEIEIMDNAVIIVLDVAKTNKYKKILKNLN